jgi:hypothetical protein
MSRDGLALWVFGLFGLLLLKTVRGEISVSRRFLTTAGTYLPDERSTLNGEPPISLSKSATPLNSEMIDSLYHNVVGRSNALNVPCDPLSGRINCTGKKHRDIGYSFKIPLIFTSSQGPLEADLRATAYPRDSKKS